MHPLPEPSNLNLTMHLNQQTYNRTLMDDDEIERSVGFKVTNSIVHRYSRKQLRPINLEKLDHTHRSILLCRRKSILNHQIDSDDLSDAYQDAF